MIGLSHFCKNREWHTCHGNTVINNNQYSGLWAEVFQSAFISIAWHVPCACYAVCMLCNVHAVQCACYVVCMLCSVRVMQCACCAVCLLHMQPWDFRKVAGCNIRECCQNSLSPRVQLNLNSVLLNIQESFVVVKFFMTLCLVTYP